MMASAALPEPRRKRPVGVRISPAIQVVVLCVIWYLSASAAVVTSKTVVMHTWAPFTLSCTQFAVGSVCGAGAAAWLEPKGLGSLVVPPAQRRGVFNLAACFVLGFLFTNYAFKVMAASTVETVKTAETVTSVLLTVVCSGATNDPFPAATELACMVPIIVGVFLATYSDGDVKWKGVASALVANVCFSLRGSLLKAQKFRFRKASGLLLHCANARFVAVTMLRVNVCLCECA